MYIQAGFLIFSAIFYELFGSSERLKWLPELKPELPSTSQGVMDAQSSSANLPPNPLASVSTLYIPSNININKN